jgi:hypothetical protein
MGDEDGTLDLDLLGPDTLHEGVEVPGRGVDVLVGGDEDIGRCVGHLAPSIATAS